MIRAVIFDCFGVLYVDPGVTFYEENIPDYEHKRVEISDLDKQYDYGLITADEHAKAIADMSRLDYEFVRQNVRGDHRRNEMLVNHAQSLRSRYKVGMLSNIGRGGMEPFFTEREQSELFDAVVVSSDVNMIKPHVEIFEKMAEILGLHTWECVMIDDREENCDGADRAGMQSIHFVSNDQTMSELNALLSEIDA